MESVNSTVCMVGKDSNTLNRGSMAYDAIHEAVLVLDLPFIPVFEP